MLYLLFLLAGFIPLVYGAQLLVDGASSLAARLKVPPIVIGLTVVAFGTSSPELTINLFAAFNNNSSLVLGNIVGSNILNILGILGIAALIYPLEVKSRTTWIEVPLVFLAAVVLLVMASTRILDGLAFGGILRSDGIILLLFLIIFLVYSFLSIAGDKSGDLDKIESMPLLRSLMYFVIGLVLLIVGGRVIVHYAVLLAKQIGMSERVIALTIVSVGTSLPELAASAVAAYKKNVDIAIGNVVGSNIFNTFFVLGVTATVYPVDVPPSFNLDLAVHTGAAGLLFAVIFLGSGRRIDRKEGALFVGLYIAYVAVLLSS